MWIHFSQYALITGILWMLCWAFLIKKNSREHLPAILALLGSTVMAIFTVQLWIELGRPPLRTLGETRLWYSVALSFIGLLLYLRWRFSLFLVYCQLLALVFLIINVLKPETHSKTLMPALQSPWFIPHVIVYMIAYACLAASFVAATTGITKRFPQWPQSRCIEVADRMVYIGFAFLTMGLIFGALWAKEAWSHYWTWDPKETWAFITWGVYLVYIHIQHRGTRSANTNLIILSISFVALLVCWFGINYLPAAQNSVHVYSR